MNFEQARFNMVEQQVRPWEVLDEQVLGLLETIHREDFVPVRYRKMAFADLAVPLGHEQTMMKPVVEGRLLQALGLKAGIVGAFHDKEVAEVMKLPRSHEPLLIMPIGYAA